MRRCLVALFAVTGILAIPRPLARADEPTSLQDQYLRIYLKINEADQYERQGDYRSALANFQDCYKRLQRIHDSNPNWESALVVQRMRDCKREIDVLTDKAAAQAPPPAPADTGPAPSGAATTTGTDTTSGDVVTDDPIALKKRLAEVEQQLADLKLKYNNAQLENKTLRSQLDAVNQQLVALKNQQPVDDRVGQLMAQNQDLNAKLLDAQKQITAMTSGPKSSAALLRAQLKTAQDKLVESEAANSALQQTTTVLRQQLDQAQADLTTSNQKLASAPTNTPEYATLKHENEVMRGILQREVQEQSRRDGAKRLAQEEFDRLKITSKVMQEQLDILGSPMTPPTNDEERALLTSLKDGGASIQPPDTGNVLSAPVSGTPGAADTNLASATPPAPAASPNVTVTPTDTPAPAAATPDPSTNAAPITVAPDSGSPTNPPATMTSSDTNMPAATDPTATKPPDVNAPVGAAPSGAAPSNPNAPTTTTLPPATTVVTNTTIPGGDTASTNQAPATATPPPIAARPRLPEDVRDTAQQASDLFKMQRYDEAAGKYQTIIDKYPDSLYAWSNLGVVRFQQGNLPEALKALQQAVKLSPTDAFSYSNLGIVYYQMNQYESAIQALERALALDPNDAKSHNYLGCACSQKGWQEVAEREFRKAIELDDTFGDAHFNLALIYATSKPPSLELARRHYNRALELGIGKDARLEKLLAQ